MESVEMLIEQEDHAAVAAIRDAVPALVAVYRFGSSVIGEQVALGEGGMGQVYRATDTKRPAVGGSGPLSAYGNDLAGYDRAQDRQEFGNE